MAEILMEPRLSFVTLGVADVAASRKFYEALGFRASSASQPDVAFFDAGGVVLAVFGRAALAEDAGVAADKPGFSGVALAHNVRSEADVDSVLAGGRGGGRQAPQARSESLLGRLLRLFCRPGRARMGSRLQPLHAA